MVEVAGELIPRKARRRAELLERFMDILNDLRAESVNGVPIIVEGRRDAESLRKLGVEGEIVLVKSIRGIRSKFERREVESVILLPDLDKEGEHTLKLIKKNLEGVVKKINTNYWRRLKVFKRIGFTQIENLYLVPEKIQPRSSPPL